MRQVRLYALLLPIVLIACVSAPPAVVEEEPVAVELEPQVQEDESVSLTVSQEMYDNTLEEVKLFIDSLNTLIRNKNYAQWKDILSDEFFAHISSPDFLAETSESAALKTRKIVLKTPNDYFLNVVVPSRSNSKVDEIEFASEDEVKVFYLDRPKNANTGEIEIRRLRLYELKKDGDTWKIID